jgi:1-acyl-sn-glycerol-3-phosphate acyltransferase
MWGVDPPKKGAAWLAWMSGAPLVPVAIHGTQDSLAPKARSFRRTAVRMWIDKPLWWYDYADRVDPLQSMMSDWYETVNAHLEPWRHE